MTATAVVNAPNWRTESLFTKVRNLSSKSQFFGFLPEHGSTLGALEQYIFAGSPDQLLGRRVTPNGRAWRSFQNALVGVTGINGGKSILALVHTPVVIMEDTAESFSDFGYVAGIKALTFTSTTAGVATPPWVSGATSLPSSAVPKHGAD